MPDTTTIDFSAVARPTAEARGLPNPCYVDRDYFLRERERVFARGWACVGVASELAAVGDHRPVDLMGMPLLLLRDREGKVRVFHNVCSHRGVALVERPGNGPVLRCPYHSWAYDLGGRLVRTPDFGGPGVNEVPDIDRRELGLREVRTGQWLDFVFVNVSGDAEPLQDWLNVVRVEVSGGLNFGLAWPWILCHGNCRGQHQRKERDETGRLHRLPPP